jgi:uncharacterized FAD-dependent dehydrogenase
MQIPSEIEITVLPEHAFEETQLGPYLKEKLGREFEKIKGIRIRKRSVDARGGRVKFVLRVELVSSGENAAQKPFFLKENQVRNAPEVFIAGAGPAGYFAAIRLIESGFRPVILERGKRIRERRRDLANLTKHHVVNPESNYCFGEGGAGTYSDGKLYTRSDKRGDVNRILQIFRFFGAEPDIEINARPHIGTNKLPGIMEKMRDFILSSGGDIRFETKLTDVETQFGKMHRIILNGNETIPAKKLILATGHSAEDIYHMLHHRRLKLDAKPFALGVRAEHPQELINRIQYKNDFNNPWLPPAYYSLVTQVEGRGVYSFCMCPGGIIAPCSTEDGLIVTNGWSPSKRNNPFANSGIVTEIGPEEFARFGDPEKNPLIGLEIRRKVEQACCIGGPGSQTAPAQRLTDLVRGKASSNLPVCSYTPGVQTAELGAVLPDFVYERLRKAFHDFGKKMKGYLTEEALAVATESRTSSAVRIPRDKETFNHPEAEGLFPCAEGAGYAGGIVSAAIDGERCAIASIQ